MQIGLFIATPDGFSGRLRTLTLDVELRLVPALPKDSDKAPDWRVLLAGDAPIEMGAGWTHEGANGGTYVAVQLDCPTFARSIRANLVRSIARDGEHVLLWSPRVRRASER